MSHFVGLCFGSSWEYNLDSYDENLEVEPYIKYTKEEAIEEAQTRHKSRFEWALSVFRKESNISQERSEYLNEIINKGSYLSDEDAWEEAKKWGYELDNDENLLSTYNPDSKWDWYAIGGRWDGFLVVKERNSEGEIIKVNQAYVNEIDWNYMFKNNKIPFCFVNELGDWLEKGSMGWWAIVSNEKDDDTWDKKFEDYVKSLDPNCLVTVVDFHI